MENLTDTMGDNVLDFAQHVVARRQNLDRASAVQADDETADSSVGYLTERFARLQKDLEAEAKAPPRDEHETGDSYHAYLIERFSRLREDLEAEAQAPPRDEQVPGASYHAYVRERFARLHEDLEAEANAPPRDERDTDDSNRAYVATTWRRCARRPTIHRTLGRRAPRRTTRRAAARPQAADDGGDGNGDGNGDATSPEATESSPPTWTSRHDLPVYLSIPETADLLRTSAKAIYAMAERGLLPGLTHFGRRLLVERDRLLKSLDEGSAPSPERR